MDNRGSLKTDAGIAVGFWLVQDCQELEGILAVKDEAGHSFNGCWPCSDVWLMPEMAKMQPPFQVRLWGGGLTLDLKVGIDDAPLAHVCAGCHAEAAAERARVTALARK